MQADIAQDYFNLRGFDSQVDILARNLGLFEKSLALTQTQYKSGLAPKTDVLQAQTLVETTRTQLTEAQRQRADLEHALAILIGLPPSAFSLAPKPLATAVPVVPPGLPSDLLGRRPDVAEAEHQLTSANANIGVAKANYYPRLMLTGTAGFETINTSQAVDWQSRIWSLGPSLSIPLFQGGALDAALEQNKERYNELLADYRTAILGAYRDVENALNDLHRYADEAASQDRSLGSARESYRLVDLQYREGITSYLQVLVSGQTLLANELTASQIQNQRLVSTVSLIKAIGGGWDPKAPLPFDEKKDDTKPDAAK